MGNDRLLLHPASWPALHPGDDLSGSDHNHFFVPSAAGTYVDISHDLGLDVPQVTRGIATADSHWFSRRDVKLMIATPTVRRSW